MAAGIFNPENDFWRLIEKLVDLFLLSVFWLVCSLPVFTLGPATAALYRTVARCIRGSERKSWSLFFRTFRENFKVGALTTLVVVAVGAVLFVLYTLLYQTASLNRAGYILFMAYYVFLLLPLGLLCYLFPVLSQFEFGVGGLPLQLRQAGHRPPALYDRLGAAAVCRPDGVSQLLPVSQSPPPFWPCSTPLLLSASSPPYLPPAVGRR